MLLRDESFLTIQGGGPEGDRLAGAMAGAHHALGKRFNYYAGTSIGAVNAACGAFHIDDGRVQDLYQIYLQHNRMLDPSANAFAKLQLLQWDRLKEMCERVFGKNARFGDAISGLIVCVTSLDTKSPMYLSKGETPNVLISEGLRASCAVHPRITGAQEIKSLGTSLSPDRRLFIDGGWTDNTCDAVFDSRGARIALRLESEKPERVRNVFQGGLPFEEDVATLKCALYSSSQPKTKRSDGIDIILPRGLGWDFSKSDEEIRTSWRIGFRRTVEQIDEVLNAARE